MATATDGPTPLTPLTPLTLPVSLRPYGWGRYVDAAFLICWLAMWVVGEVVVALLTCGTIVSLIAASLGLPLPAFFPKTTDPGVAAGFLLFGLIWLSLWTIGGAAAGTHLLRGLAGEDRVSLTPAALIIYRRAWIFHRTRTIPRAGIRRVGIRTGDHSVTVYTGTDGMQVVTTLGTPREREELRAALAAALVLPDAATVKRLEAQTPPPDWESEQRRADLVLMRPTRRTRRRQATIMWSVTGLVSLAVIASLVKPIGSGGFVFDKVSWSLTLLCGLLAAWITWGGTEWIVRRGRLTHRLFFADLARERVFDDGWLEMSQSTDSDGDVHHALRVSAPKEDERNGSGAGDTNTAGGHERPRRRKKIASALHESCEVAWLGEWLAHQTGFPFDKDA
jgi:hypothetical protein